jgi:hypothetical protein
MITMMTLIKKKEKKRKKRLIILRVSPRGEGKTKHHYFQQANGHHWPARPKRNG